MVRIVASVVLLVLLAIFVSMNLGYSASINLMGVRIIENVSVVAISALSFAFGIVYSLFIYLGSYMHRKAERDLASKVRNVSERRKQLDSREKEQEHTVKSAAANLKPQTTMPLD